MTANTTSAPPPAAPDLSEGLVGAKALAALLGTPELLVFDCRHDLAQPGLGEEQYRRAHVPGAHFLHLDRDLSGTKSHGSGRHPLPERDALAARLRALGMRRDSRVVAYDASEGSFAARAWWLLRWLGHEQVAVLDGGWSAWLAAEGPTTDLIPAAVPGDFAPRTSLQPTVDAEAVLRVARAPGAGAGAAAQHLIIDARAPDRYEGRNETIDPVGGHIPGARNRFWKSNLDASGCFKPPQVLRAEYEALLEGRRPQQLIAQCGSGVTACHDLLALHRAGLRGAALYPGSWSQWVSDATRPVATGTAP